MSHQLLLAQIETQRLAMQAHPLGDAMTSIDAWREFMQIHVFAVFDFMSLLKRLQRDLTCMTLPWTPPAHPELARLINEIVLEEETDIDHLGQSRSHFEMYLEAMSAVGADTAPILQFLVNLNQGQPWAMALERADVPAGVKAFVQQTLACAIDGKLHEVAAAFFFGREDILPHLFDQLQKSLDGHNGGLKLLKQYFKRHVELDGDHHGPMAQRLLEIACAGDPGREAEAHRAALSSLTARRRLWDAIFGQIVPS